MTTPARVLSVDLLLEWERGQANLDTLMERAYLHPSLGHRDRALVHEITYGVTRWRGWLDRVIEHHSGRQMRWMRPWLRQILRSGAYQLLFLDRVPAFAAVDEAVSLCRRFSAGPKAAGFVNAVLRRIAQGKDEARQLPVAGDPVVGLAVRTSHPPWLVRRWVKRFGLEETGRICQANNTIPLTTIRTNTLRLSTPELARLLAAEKVEVRPGLLAPEALVIAPEVGISALEAWRRGYFQVQDEASMLIPHLLDPQPGETILDCCAAPGGKATHIAQLMGNRGCVVALDVSRQRLRLIRENVDRLGTTRVWPVQGDAAKGLGLRPLFDRILVDAPCSATGVLRRHPDGKWRKRIQMVASLRRLQMAILINASRYLKPGGVLVYCTCSLEWEENEGVITDFLARQRGFRLQDAAASLPDAASSLADSQGFFTTLPLLHRMDGFFAARLLRLSSGEGGSP